MVDAPQITSPATITLGVYSVSGVSVADAFAATNPGSMALNVSATHGTLAIAGHSGSSIKLSGTLAQVNAFLATLAYTPPATPVADTIEVNVWNQAGQSTTNVIAVAAPSAAAPPVTPPVTPPVVTPPVTPPKAGVQASRIADLLSMTGGCNLFPSIVADQNTWGSYPADYTPATVEAAMAWLTNGSGVMPLSRVYFFADRLALMQEWMPLAAAAGMRFSICIGDGGGTADVPGLLTLAGAPANGIVQIEGLNEPNANGVTIASSRAVQDALWAGKPTGMTVAGPSIVFGLPEPGGYVTDYADPTDLADLLGHMDVGNVHVYPPSLVDLDDGSNAGGVMAEIVKQLGTVYGGKPLVMTEWQPTLYDAATPGSNPALDGYYAPLMLLSAFRNGIRGAQYFPLLDFGTTYQCGLFPTNATNPRPAAWSIRALHTLTGDVGAGAHTFTPGTLAVTVTGGPGPINAASPETGMGTDLFQASDGRFFLVVRNEQDAAGGAASPVSVEFGTAPTKVTEYGITGDATFDTPLQTVAGQATLATTMNACVRLLVIEP